MEIILLRYIFSIPDEIKAIRDVWLVGDDSLSKIYGGLQHLKSRRESKHEKGPYIYEFYSVSAWYMNPLSEVRPTIARLQNALTEALNQNIYLPKYIIIIPEKDIVESAFKSDSCSNREIEDQANWLIGQVSKLLMARREDLKSKKPGSVTADLTRVIWVNMLARPEYNNPYLNTLFDLRQTYNGKMKKLLEVEKYMHIIEVPNMEEYKYFNKQGELTTLGKEEFWLNFNAELKALDATPKENLKLDIKKNKKKEDEIKPTKKEQDHKKSPKKREETRSTPVRRDRKINNIPRRWLENHYEQRRRLPSPPNHRYNNRRSSTHHTSDRYYDKYY